MKYLFVPYNEIDTFDFTQCTINGEQVCTKKNCRKSFDLTEFLVVGDNLTEGITLEAVQTYISNNNSNWNSTTIGV